MNKIIIVLFLSMLSGVAQSTTSLTNLIMVPEATRRSAPDFVAENLHGGNTALQDYKGKIVLLNFWATWCMPCREEMPGMEMLWQKYRAQGLVVVAVSNDEGSRARVEKFSEIFDLSFPILLDPEGEVNDLYNVSSMPTSFLIDADGKIISRIVGTEEWSSAAAYQLVEKLLSQ